jgi:hypothetical protein
MNQSQLKFARARAETILKRRLEALQTRLTTPAVSLSDEEKLTALEAGAFRICPATRYRSWYNRVKFTGEYGGLDAEAYALGEKDLRAQFAKLEEELVLGDNTAALEALRAFAEGDEEAA